MSLMEIYKHARRVGCEASAEIIVDDNGEAKTYLEGCLIGSFDTAETALNSLAAKLPSIPADFDHPAWSSNHLSHKSFEGK